MDWLNLHISTLDSPAFVGATPVERATWLCLLRFCMGQENAGRILECSEWGDGKWQQMCRVKLKEVRLASELWFWEEFNLVVNFYPKKQERSVRKNRRDGHKGGRPKEKQYNPPDNGGGGSDETDPANERVRGKVSGSKVNGKEVSKGKSDSENADPKAAPKGDHTTTRPSWADTHPEEFARMLAAFQAPGSKAMAVVRFFRCKMQTKKDGPIDHEWERRTHGQTAEETFLVFAGEPEGTLEMPSQYAEARHRFTYTDAK